MSRNPLRDRSPPDPPEAPPRPATERTQVAQLLAGINQDLANDLYETFNQRALELGVNNPEAMWAVAMLQARVLAAAEIGDQQMWVAARFNEMVKVALPAMIAAVERGKRAHEGRQPHDA